MPADITLAVLNGQGWAVGGLGHLDDLLSNTLPSGLSIEIVECASRAELEELRAAEADGGWMIHPAILARVRGALGGMEVRFAAWSALLDEPALLAIAAAAAAAARDVSAEVVLTRHVAAGSARAVTDMADLRASLIEAQLAQHGVAPERMRRETDSSEDRGERISVSVRAR